jgi:exocyst complex component 8
MPVILMDNTARAILSGFSSDPGKLDGVKEEIDTYVDKLSKAIGRDLSNSLLTKVQFQRNVNWLLRLGLGETVCWLPFMIYTSH